MSMCLCVSGFVFLLTETLDELKMYTITMDYLLNNVLNLIVVLLNTPIICKVYFDNILCCAKQNNYKP